MCCAFGSVFLQLAIFFSPIIFANARCSPLPPLCSNTTVWRRTPGGLDTLAVGPGGMWGVNNGNQVWHRDGTYGDPGNFGTGWTRVDGLLQRLDVGDDVVWGITLDGNLTCRVGITDSTVTGTSWLNLTTKAIDVSISPNGFLIAIAENGTLFYREGLSGACGDVSEWVMDMDSSVTVRQVSVGKSGIWAVDVNDVVHYKRLSFGDVGSVGTGWTQVDRSMIWVGAGEFIVMGVDANNEIWRRDRVTETNPEGLPWVMLTGRLKNVDAYDGCYAWGVNSISRVWLGTFH